MLTRITEYIRRIGRAHGFGIQSPWAFGFVTEVIGERLPYYAYGDIDALYGSHRERNFRKLMLRVRNFVYPHEVVVIDDVTVLSDERLGTIVNDIGPGGVIVIRGIWASDAALSRWREIQQREEIGVTFDLYDCAVCFLDRLIFKQHYRLNYCFHPYI